MWRRMTLGDVADAGQYGLNAAALKEGNGVRFIRITDIDASGKLAGADPAYVDATMPGLDRYYLGPGDLLIARSGATAGKSLLFRGLAEPAVFAGYLIRFKVHVDRALPEYLAYFLQSSTYWGYIRTTARTVAQPNVNARELASVPVDLPPLSEQHRIVDLLSRAENILRMRREAEQKAKEIIPALFLDMFGDPATNPKGWACRPLGEILASIDSGRSPICLDRPRQVGEWGVLKLGAVTWGRYDEADNKTLPLSVAPHEESEVRTGDVLLSRKNTYQLVGASAYVWETAGRILLPDLIFRLNLGSSEEVDPIYLWSLLSTPSKREQLRALASGAAASMPNISKERLRGLAVELPPLKRQLEFSRTVRDAHKFDGQRSKADSLATQAFHSLVAAAFSERN